MSASKTKSPRGTGRRPVLWNLQYIALLLLLLRCCAAAICSLPHITRRIAAATTKYPSYRHPRTLYDHGHDACGLVLFRFQSHSHSHVQTARIRNRNRNNPRPTPAPAHRSAPYTSVCLTRAHSVSVFCVRSRVCEPMQKSTWRWMRLERPLQSPTKPVVSASALATAIAPAPARVKSRVRARARVPTAIAAPRPPTFPTVHLPAPGRGPLSSTTALQWPSARTR